MPLSISKDQNNAPVLICDHCGYEIRLASDGDAVWLPDRNQLAVLHRTCTSLFGTLHETEPMRTRPLDTYVRELLERIGDTGS